MDKTDLFAPVDKEYDEVAKFVEKIIQKITNTVSDFYGVEYILKTFCYTEMDAGTKNRVHSDNKYIDEDGNLKERPSEIEDRSVLLYLNDDYDGGNLIFPKHNISIKPKPGTLIFFEGDENNIHGVEEVKSGKRINMITFLWPKKYAGKSPEIVHGVELLEFPIN